MDQSSSPHGTRLGGAMLISAQSLAETKKNMADTRMKTGESRNRIIESTRQLVVSAEWSASTLDNQGCLSLEQILKSFSAPISEEHAWAIIHQVRTYRTYRTCRILANYFHKFSKCIKLQV